MKKKASTVFPELKRLGSPDLGSGELPPDPDDCAVYVEAEIGSRDSIGADIYGLWVVTPRYLTGNRMGPIGKGYLVLPQFSWQGVEEYLAALLRDCSGPSWLSVQSALTEKLFWEYDDYVRRSWLG